MLWIPRVDEIPISLVGQNQIAVKDVGDATHALHEKKVGDFIGVRGPYGNCFEPTKNQLLVGGGVGIAPIAFLGKQGFKAVIGARNADELFFENWFEEPVICTDDGSKGRKGFVTDATDELLGSGEFDCVIACGPEIMLKFLFQVCEKHQVPVQFSMERWMKCGIGICGHCSTLPGGWRVCKDGPVASTEVLKQSKEFFEFKRGPAGTKAKL